MDLNGVALSFESPLRFSNHSGGVSCLSAANRLHWLMLPGDYMTVWSSLDDRQTVESIIGLRELSFSIHETVESLHDPFAEFHLNIPGRCGKYLDYEQMARWSGLSIAYRNRGELRRALRAERISKQIRFCCNSFDELYKCYRNCVAGEVNPEKVSEIEGDLKLRFFSNRMSLLIGYKIQPYLDALFSLRDFITNFIFEEMYEESREPRKDNYATFFAADDRFMLARLMVPAFSQREPPGIVARFSTYRNVFFHYIGIGSSGPVPSCYTYRHVESRLGKKPFMIYPLDDNYERLRAIETGRFLEVSHKAAAQKEAERFMSILKPIDAVDLCFDSLHCLLRIAEAAEARIEIASEVIQITADDVIKATLRSEDGKERHYARDEHGTLREL